MCRRGGNSQQIEEEESKKAMEDSEEKGGQNKITSQCVYVDIYVYVYVCIYVSTEYLHQEILVLKTEHAFVVFLSTHFIPIAAVIFCQCSAIISEKTTRHKKPSSSFGFLTCPSFSLCSVLDCLCRPKKKKEKGVKFTIQIAQEP